MLRGMNGVNFSSRDDEEVTQTSIHKWVPPRPYSFYGTILGLLGVTSMMNINASESAPLCSSGMAATNIGWAKVAPNEQQLERVGNSQNAIDMLARFVVRRSS